MRFWLVAVALAACVRSGVIVCEDGRVCPSGSTCDEIHGLCVLESQLEVCLGITDGTACTIQSTNDGTCRDGVCIGVQCGDGIATSTEQCDGDDLALATCVSLGAHQPGELRCTSSCAFDTSACGPMCGNGVLDGPPTAEECDGPNVPTDRDDCLELGYYDPGPVTCSNRCAINDNTCTGFCGDAVVNGSELCDGSEPAQGTCLDFGYDVGRLGCNQFCGAAFADCSFLGWKPANAGAIGDFYGVWAASPSEAYAVGTGGAIRRFDGAKWNAETSGTQVDLSAVWGIGDDVFAVGGTALLRRQAGTWSTAPTVASTHAYNAVFGFAPDNVYAVGRLNTGGNEGIVVHFNGTAWSVATELPWQALSIWGAAPDDLWVSDFQGHLHHYNGSTWTDLATLPSSTTALWGFASDDIWVMADGAYHYDGQNWTLSPGSPTSLRYVWGTSSQNLFVATVLGVFHFDGTDWTRQEYPGGFIWSLGGSDPRFALIGSELGGVRTYSGASLLVPTTYSAANSCYAPDPHTLYVATDDGVSRFDGTQATPVSGVPVSVPRAIWGTGTTNLFVGNTVIARQGPSGWETHTLPVGFGGVTSFWGSSPTDVYATGVTSSSNGVVLKWNGATAWTEVTSVAATALRAIWGRSATDIFAVGANGAIVHFNGSSWMPQASPTSSTLVEMWGSGSNIYAVTTGGEIVRHDGTAWSVESAPFVGPLTSIWGFAPDDIFVASTTTSLLHYDGERWSPIRVPWQPMSVCGAIGSRVGLFGSSGAFFRVQWLERQTRWACRSAETICDDRIDDDCDGAIDDGDSDCP